MRLRELGQRTLEPWTLIPALRSKSASKTPLPTLPPVAGSSARALANRLSSFRDALRANVGQEAMDRLAATAKENDSPIVLIKGDMLTGKSTQARAVAESLGRPGEVGSVGSQVMRPLAEKRGITIEELGAQLKAEPTLEATLDYEALMLAARGGVAVLESRMAGEYGALLQSLGRKNVLTVELRCGARERALRMVERLAGSEARRRIEPRLSEIKGGSLEAYLGAIVALKEPEPKLAELAQHGAEIAGRDDVDAARLRKLYGFDYRQDGHGSDIVLDTSALDSNQVRGELIRRVLARYRRDEPGFGRDRFAQHVEAQPDSAREADLRATFGTRKASVPALLEDWSNATLEAAARASARKTYASEIQEALRVASQDLGRELNRSERSAIVRAVDQVYLPAAITEARRGIYASQPSQARTIKNAQLDYARFSAPKQRDPFLPIVAGDRAARAQEVVLWESPSLMVLVDRFTPTPQALVVPKRSISFPTQASRDELAEMARVAQAVSSAFSQLSGAAPAEIWINAPQDLSVTRLHVHVAPQLDRASKSPELWSKLAEILQASLGDRSGDPQRNSRPGANP